MIPYGGGAALSALTSAGTYEVGITGLAAIRARATSAIIGGPVNVLVRAAFGNKSLRVGAPSGNPLPVTSTTNGTGGFSGTLVGTSATPVLAARVAPQRDLTLRNESTSASIAVAFGAQPFLNTAGSITLGPGDSLNWSGSYVPLDAINAIASAAGAQLTIGSH